MVQLDFIKTHLADQDKLIEEIMMKIRHLKKRDKKMMTKVMNVNEEDD